MFVDVCLPACLFIIWKWLYELFMKMLLQIKYILHQQLFVFFEKNHFILVIRKNRLNKLLPNTQP